MSRLDKKNGEKEYFKPIRVALKSIFNFGNVISALNIWVVVTVRYGAGIINWNKEELDRLDRKSRKLIVMHGGLHPCLNVDKLFSQELTIVGRLMSVRDCVEAERSNLLFHSVNSDKKFLKAASEEIQLEARIGEKIKNKERRKDWTNVRRKFYTDNSWEKRLKNWKRQGDRSA